MKKLSLSFIFIFLLSLTLVIGEKSLAQDNSYLNKKTPVCGDDEYIKGKGKGK